MDTLLRLHPC
ncbi:hypothetical protein LINGRAHAP2_LOCUS31607 [Linum grandiflorum]